MASPKFRCTPAYHPAYSHRNTDPRTLGVFYLVKKGLEAHIGIYSHWDAIPTAAQTPPPKKELDWAKICARWGDFCVANHQHREPAAQITDEQLYRRWARECLENSQAPMLADDQDDQDDSIEEIAPPDSPTPTPPSSPVKRATSPKKMSRSASTVQESASTRAPGLPSFLSASASPSKRSGKARSTQEQPTLYLVEYNDTRHVFASVSDAFAAAEREGGDDSIQIHRGSKSDARRWMEGL